MLTNYEEFQFPAENYGYETKYIFLCVEFWFVSSMLSFVYQMVRVKCEFLVEFCSYIQSAIVIYF